MMSARFAAPNPEPLRVYVKCADEAVESTVGHIDLIREGRDDAVVDLGKNTIRDLHVDSLLQGDAAFHTRHAVVVEGPRALKGELADRHMLRSRDADQRELVHGRAKDAGAARAEQRHVGAQAQGRAQEVHARGDVHDAAIGRGRIDRALDGRRVVDVIALAAAGAKVFDVIQRCVGRRLCFCLLRRSKQFAACDDGKTGSTQR